MSKTKKLIFRLKGGLGNQLFQYACAVRMAREFGAELYFDASILLPGDAIGRKLEIDRIFPGKVNLANIAPSMPVVREEDAARLTAAIESGFAGGAEELAVDGYFQHEHCFLPDAIAIKTDLMNFRSQRLAGRGLQRLCSRTVGLHVRRSDYQHLGVCADEYYLETIRWFQRKFAGDVEFFVFTDEPLYTSNMLGALVGEARVTVVNTGDHLSDFLLLSTCDHFVVANSTFSWWAAYLGETSNSIIFAPTAPWLLGSELNPAPDRWARVAGVVSRSVSLPDVKDKVKWAYFTASYYKYQSAAVLLGAGVMQADPSQLFPCLDDDVGVHPIEPHYLYHPAWALRKLLEHRIEQLYDFGSTLNFATMASAVSKVVLHDFRPPQVFLSNLECRSCDLLSLGYESDSLPAVSCMHTIEHIGLGRYGDSVNPAGDRIATAELVRVLKPGGLMLFVVPVGQPRLQFNAHRIYSFEQVQTMMQPLELVECSLIPDNAVQVGMIDNPAPAMINQQQHGCGCFVFRKRSA
ncbi:MAG: alpha-1,2-fucosyltransferase [Gallionella sp.]|nr:alpha-1,2-fucosyltransferase [Gallionella sp.]